MKKVLMGTSALAVASLMAGAAGAAEAPSMIVSGGLDYHIRTISASQGVNSGGKGIEINSQQYMSELAFRGEGKTDTGLSYAAEIQFRPINMSIDEAFLTFGGDFGTIALGDEDGPFGSEIYGFSILPVGGIDAGMWGDYLSREANGGSSDMHALNGGYSESFDASKVMYKTPSMSGLQLALSVTPDTNSNFGADNADGHNGYHNLMEAGLTYSGDMGGGTAVGFSAAVSSGASATPGLEDANAMQVGVRASMNNFTVAMGYGDRGEGGCTIGAAGCSNGNLTDFGIAYSMDKVSLGLGFASGDNQSSNTVKNEFTTTSVEFGYAVADGLRAYAGIQRANADSTNGAVKTSNDTTTFVLGTGISF